MGKVRHPALSKERNENMRKKFQTRYRIVRDKHAGYEAQLKKWWWPFWWQISAGNGFFVNTHRTVEDAEEFIKNHKVHGVVKKPKQKGVVKEVFVDF